LQEYLDDNDNETSEWVYFVERVMQYLRPPHIIELLFSMFTFYYSLKYIRKSQTLQIGVSVENPTSVKSPHREKQFYDMRRPQILHEFSSVPAWLDGEREETLQEYLDDNDNETSEWVYFVEQIGVSVENPTSVKSPHREKQFYDMRRPQILHDTFHEVNPLVSWAQVFSVL
jgi:hypothetical protein